MEIYPTSAYDHHRYRSCDRCGGPTYNVVIDFDAGAVCPTVGETLTGAASGATGVVVETNLVSGTYAGGDAAGRVLLETPTGYDTFQGTCFSDNEAVTGSVGGVAMLTVDGAGAFKVNGRLYPEGEVNNIDGRWLCREHYEREYPKKGLDEAWIDADEERNA